MPKEGHILQFRMEAFNLLNHPVLGTAERKLLQSAVRNDQLDQRFDASNAAGAEIHLLTTRAAILEPQASISGANRLAVPGRLEQCFDHPNIAG
jgi:hypothetical protein